MNGMKAVYRDEIHIHILGQLLIDDVQHNKNESRIDLFSFMVTKESAYV